MHKPRPFLALDAGLTHSARSLEGGCALEQQLRKQPVDNAARARRDKLLELLSGPVDVGLHGKKQEQNGFPERSNLRREASTSQATKANSKTKTQFNECPSNPPPPLPSTADNEKQTQTGLDHAGVEESSLPWWLLPPIPGLVAAAGPRGGLLGRGFDEARGLVRGPVVNFTYSQHDGKVMLYRPVSKRVSK